MPSRGIRPVWRLLYGSHWSRQYLRHMRSLAPIEAHFPSLSSLTFPISVRGKKDDATSTVSHLFVPVAVKPNNEATNVGAELTGKLNKQDVLKILNKFFRRSEIKLVAFENGLDSKYALTCLRPSFYIK